MITRLLPALTVLLLAAPLSTLSARDADKLTDGTRQPEARLRFATVAIDIPAEFGRAIISIQGLARSYE